MYVIVKDKAIRKGFDAIDTLFTKALIGSELFEDDSFFRSYEGLSLLVLCLFIYSHRRWRA
ncbi:MAG: hypothetical protein HQL06_15785 [Nitrospirae bacterium]|nr:hypothetical protein [Nitrospirota bacterium]